MTTNFDAIVVGARAPANLAQRRIRIPTKEMRRAPALAMGVDPLDPGS